MCLCLCFFSTAVCECCLDVSRCAVFCSFITEVAGELYCVRQEVVHEMNSRGFEAACFDDGEVCKCEVALSPLQLSLVVDLTNPKIERNP
jgi:hypothetical protein